MTADIRFFATPAKFRRWLTENHARADALWVGFYRKDSGKPSMTWEESVDEALCVGWIDGIRKRIDETRYKIRFTPRRKASIWSAVNIRHVARLKKERRMQPAGENAFAARRENMSGIYAYEQRSAELLPAHARVLEKNRAAWDFFQTQAPSYRKVIAWWLMSAKQEATLEKRLLKLTEASANRRRL